MSESENSEIMAEVGRVLKAAHQQLLENAQALQEELQLTRNEANALDRAWSRWDVNVLSRWLNAEQISYIRSQQAKEDSITASEAARDKGYQDGNSGSLPSYGGEFPGEYLRGYDLSSERLHGPKSWWKLSHAGVFLGNVRGHTAEEANARAQILGLSSPASTVLEVVRAPVR